MRILKILLIIKYKIPIQILVAKLIPASTNFLPKMTSDDEIVYDNEYDDESPSLENAPKYQNHNHENSLMIGAALQTNLQNIEYDDGA